MTDQVDLFRILKKYDEHKMLETFPFSKIRHNYDVNNFIDTIAKFSDESVWTPEEILQQEQFVEMICLQHNILMVLQADPDPDKEFRDEEFLDIVETLLGWYEATIWQY